MAEEKDFNEVLDDILLAENTCYRKSYEEGLKSGSSQGNPEGYHLGYHRGAELGREIGYYLGIVTFHIEKNSKASNSIYSEKVLNQLIKVKEVAESFPHSNSEEVDILGMANELRAQYKKACSLLKISPNLPYGQATMEETMKKLQQQIDVITKYLTPYLPLVNCHMVEYFTNSHWENLLPTALRQELNNSDWDNNIQKFWNFTENHEENDTSELSKFITKAHSHYLKVDSALCLSQDQFKNKIKTMGVDFNTEIHVKEFMSAKKSYEVQTISPFVASLYEATQSTHCIDLGGGRGYLPVVLDLGYSVPSVAVDCDLVALEGGKKRDRLIKKQWPSIAKRVCKNINTSLEKKEESMHYFAHSYVTQDSDLSQIILDHFPKYHKEDVKLLLTGLHTCGDLGPDSLRIFLSNRNISAVFNVPCCYHLLTEAVDKNMFWNAFEKTHISKNDNDQFGFPMSSYLAGYNIGRMARMTAAQSIDRVASEKQLPSISLFYRAILQVLIERYLPNSNIPEGKLKRTATKSKDFIEYFKQADAILNLGLHDTLSVSDLTDVYNSFSCQWKKMILFYLLRLCLAQVVESLILLDRLMFLNENGFKDSFLVKIFDAKLSPRCHAIVAVRN